MLKIIYKSIYTFKLYEKEKKKTNFWPLDGSYHLTTYLNLREIVAKTIKKTT